MAFDNAVVVNGHVVWALLSADEQADLVLNYPHQANLTDGQFEAWLDSAYLARHITDGDAPDWTD